jgi:hypothetical protein
MKETDMKSRNFPILAAIVLAFAAGAAIAQTKSGDSWSFEARNGYNKKVLTTYRVDVTGVSDSGIDVDVANGRTGTVSQEKFTTHWDPVAADWPEGHFYQFTPAFPEYPDRLEPGVKWHGDTIARDPATGRQMKMSSYGTVIGRERVHVPAGDFDAIKISRDTVLDDADFWRLRTHVIEYEWYVPALGRLVKRDTHSSFLESMGRHPVEHAGDWTIVELTAYKLK